MALRLKLLQLATVSLYMGPLLAGMAGFGWAMLPPFVSLFVAWLIILRPHQWPRSNAEWLQAKCWISVFSQVVTQILLVAVLFGIGRGIGGVSGNLPLFTPILPMALTFLALPLGRIIWNGEKAMARGETIDEMLYAPARPVQPTVQSISPEVEAAPLLAMADDCALSDVGPALEDAMEDAGAWAVLSVLTKALDEAPGRHFALREALIVWATDPDTFAAKAAPEAMRAAFQVAGSDLRLLQALLPRAAALARIMPERRAQFPDRARIEALADLSLPGQLAADHSALLVALSPRPSPMAMPRMAGVRNAGAQPS